MRRGELFQEILDSLSLSDWLDREGIEYKETHGSRGLQLNIRECPVCHNDKWKVYANAETGLGNCFRCEQRFNKWSLIRATLPEHSNGEVMALIEQVAKEQGWRAPRRIAVATNVRELEIPHSYELPMPDGRNLAYLTRRGIDADTTRYFGLRYCHEGKFHGQDFGRRIIIPVFDLDGELVTFQGRDVTGEAERKYLFPAGFAVTGQHLYNGQNVHATKRVAVGEGAFDVMAMKLALDGDMALRDVVPIGTFGKHLSAGGEDDQLAKFDALRRVGVEQVTFMWDSEREALAAAVKAGIELKRLGLIVRIAVLPPGKDPNECPASAVREAFYRAEVVSPHIGARLRLALRA